MENVIGIQMLDISVPAREKYQKLVYVPPPAPGSGSGVRRRKSRTGVRLRGPAPEVRLRGPEAAGMSSSSPPPGGGGGEGETHLTKPR